MKIGNQIKKLRLEYGYTQKELSSKIGLSPKMISFYENGERIPPMDIVMKLVEIFDVTSDYLLGIDSDKQHKTEDYNSSNISPEDELLLASMTTKARNLIDTFLQLDEDNQDIILGDAKKALRDQKYIDNVSKRKDIAT